jgi:hypothetical protein
MLKKNDAKYNTITVPEFIKGIHYLKITPFCVSSAFHDANKYYSPLNALNYTLSMCVNFSEAQNSREAAVEQNLHVW